MSYRRWWTRSWACVIAMGVCWAGLVLPLSLAAGVLCLGGFSVVLACAALEPDDNADDHGLALHGAWRRMAWGGTSWLAVAGLLRPAPALVGALLVAAAVSSPATVAWVSGLLHRGSRDEVPESLPHPVPEPAGSRPVKILVTMSDAGLCRLWTDSYWALRRSPSGVERRLLIELRGHVLDEMERRDARAMMTWLSAGARPHQSPLAYFRGEP